MKHWVYSISKWVVLFLASSLVFLGLMTLTAWMLTPYLNKKTQLITRIAESLLHKPLQINQFLLTWEGLTPILQGKIIILDNARVHSLFIVERLRVAIDFFKSLFRGHITVKEIDINGIKLAIHLSKATPIKFSEISTLLVPSPETVLKEKQSGLLKFLLTEPCRLSVKNISLRLYVGSNSLCPTLQMNGFLKNKGSRHLISGVLCFNDKKLSKLNVKMDFSGGKKQTKLLVGRIFLNGQNILLDRWLEQWSKNKKYRTKNAWTHFKIWADWKRDHFTKVQGLFWQPQRLSLKINQEPWIFLSPFATQIKWEKALPWNLKASVQGFGTYPWKCMPGVKNLNFYVYATPRNGKCVIHSTHLAIDFMKLFKEPIHFDELLSEFNWENKVGKWFIKVTRCEAFNRDLLLNTRGSLFIPEKHSYLKDQSGIELSLLARIKVLRPSHIAYYLPQNLLSPEIIQWIYQAPKRGTCVSRLLLQGPIRHFPFDKKEGSFFFDTQMSNVDLEYKKGWPVLQKLKGTLIFFGRQMHIFINTAKISQAAIKNIKASIPLIKKHTQAILTITTETIPTRLEKIQALWATASFAKGTLRQLRGLILNGPVQLILKMNIPLEPGKEHFRLLGQAKVEQATLKMPAYKIQLEDLNGTFLFTQTSISAKNLTALLWGKPIYLAIGPEPNVHLTMDYNGFKTKIKSVEEGWLVYLDNKVIVGKIFVPNHLKVLQANLESVYLSSSLLKKNTNSLNTWDLTDLPNIDLIAREVHYEDINLGRISLKLRPTLNGVSIRDLHAGSSNYGLIARGFWDNGKSTDFLGELDSSNLGAFLRSLGLTASLIAERAHARFHLAWSGAPYNMKFSTLRGGISLYASNGQIVDIGSSAEAKLNFGRLLTFLSVQSLTRRLQLDFSDFKSKGFDFTILQGDFAVRNGEAITRDTKIENSVASVRISGRIDMVDKEYDLFVTVIPHFTSSLPFLVGLAGGPVAGIVTWVADAVLGSSVQRIAQTSYHITGSWNRPEVTKTLAM